MVLLTDMERVMGEWRVGRSKVPSGARWALGIEQGCKSGCIQHLEETRRSQDRMRPLGKKLKIRTCRTADAEREHRKAGAYSGECGVRNRAESVLRTKE